MGSFNKKNFYLSCKNLKYNWENIESLRQICFTPSLSRSPLSRKLELGDRIHKTKMPARRLAFLLLTHQVAS